MALLVGPTYEQGAANNQAMWTDGALVGATAGFIILRVQDFVFFQDNGAWVARLYYSSSQPTHGHGTTLPTGYVLGGAQQGPFNNTVPVNVVWPASSVPSGNYAWGFVAGSTTMIQGVTFSLWDDVGGFSPGQMSYGGCCHDPMLNDILAAVTKTITNTP